MEVQLLVCDSTVSQVKECHLYPSYFKLLGCCRRSYGESHSLSMLIDALKLCADKQLELFWIYCHINE